jgi:hypothetical protein
MEPQSTRDHLLQVGLRQIRAMGYGIFGNFVHQGSSSPGLADTGRELSDKPTFEAQRDSFRAATGSSRCLAVAERIIDRIPS